MVKSPAITITVSSPTPTAIPGSITGVTVNGVPVLNGGTYTTPLGSVVTVAGTLLDTHGAPLAGWVIEAIIGGKVVQTATTDVNGHWSLSGTETAKGTFTGSFAAKGYETTIAYRITFVVT